jgi:hypothetical protein
MIPADHRCPNWDIYAREARRYFEAALDRPYPRRASLWLDALLVIEERRA